MARHPTSAAHEPCVRAEHGGTQLGEPSPSLALDTSQRHILIQMGECRPVPAVLFRVLQHGNSQPTPAPYAHTSFRQIRDDKK
jgi:hypothetical protein